MAHPDRLEGEAQPPGAAPGVPEVEAELVESAPEAAPESPERPRDEPVAAAPADRRGPSPRRPSARWLLAAVAGVIVAGGLVGVLLLIAPYARRDSAASPTSASAIAEPVTPATQSAPKAMPASAAPTSPTDAALAAGNLEAAGAPSAEPQASAGLQPIDAEPGPSDDPEIVADVVAPDSAVEDAPLLETAPVVEAAESSAPESAGDGEPSAEPEAQALISLPTDASGVAARSTEDDALARLQSDAMARERAEVAGVPPTELSDQPPDLDAGPAAAAAPPENETAAAAVAAELAALRLALEADRARLAGALDAERLRADAASAEAADLRAKLAAALASKAADDRQGARAAENDRAALAVIALWRAVESGAPFTAELEMVDAVAGEIAALAPLRPIAASGAPTLGALKGQFAPAARAALSAEARAAATGPLAPFTAGLSRLVSVRPAGPIDGETTAAIISRAEARVDVDDIAGALAELQALGDPARTAFADWVARAGLYAEARKATADLTTAFLGREVGGGSR